jgi:hypothetical protein
VDILEKLRDLHKQATTERSHYYVAKCCDEAIEEIERQREQLKDHAAFLVRRGLVKEFMETLT